MYVIKHVTASKIKFFYQRKNDLENNWEKNRSNQNYVNLELFQCYKLSINFILCGFRPNRENVVNINIYVDVFLMPGISIAQKLRITLLIFIRKKSSFTVWF